MSAPLLKNSGEMGIVLCTAGLGPGAKRSLPEAEKTMTRIGKWAGMFVPPPGRHRALRTVLLVLLLLAMFWAYSVHFSRKLDELNAGSTIVDPGGQFEPVEKKALQGLAAFYRREYGIRVRIVAHDSGKALPESSGQTLLVTLAPETGQSRIELPPLVRKALSDEAEALYAEQLAACVRVAPPGACVERFLLALRDELQQ